MKFGLTGQLPIIPFIRALEMRKGPMGMLSAPGWYVDYLRVLGRSLSCLYAFGSSMSVQFSTSHNPVIPFHRT